MSNRWTEQHQQEAIMKGWFIGELGHSQTVCASELGVTFNTHDAALEHVIKVAFDGRKLEGYTQLCRRAVRHILNTKL